MSFFAETTIVAAGAQVLFTFGFEALQPDHIKVSIDNVDTTNFTVDLDSGEVTLTPDPGLLGGELVRVYRDTPKTAAGLLVDFEDDTVLTEADQDTNTKQLLFVAQEALDQSQRASDKVDTLSVGAGNLPVVGVIDNNSGLFVEAGNWATRVPADARDHLGLSDRATTPFEESAARFGAAGATLGNAGIQNENSKIPFGTPTTIKGPTWYTLENSNKDIALDGGKYAVRLRATVASTNVSTKTTVTFAVTDEDNTPSQIVVLQASTFVLGLATANFTDRVSISDELFVNFPGTRRLCFRAWISEGHSSASLLAPTSLVIERWRT